MVPSERTSDPDVDDAPSLQTIARLAAGDGPAWEQFCRSQGRLMSAAGYKVGLSAEEREDLVQNTCVVCYHSIDRLRDPRRLDAWVYRIAYRQALEIVRRRTPAVSLEDDGGRSVLDQLPAEAPAEEEVLEAQARSRTLFGVIEALGDRCRHLLEALYLAAEPLPYEEVSRRLGMPIGSIGPTRARCLDQVRRRWKQVSGGGAFPTLRRQESSKGHTGERGS